VALYPALKIVHVSTVTLSVSLFLLRAGWMLADSPRLNRLWVRVLPHVNDTLLLAAALGMVYLSKQYPFVEPWLTAKLLALLVYIVAGSIALRRGRTRGVRLAALALALVSVIYILAVALTRSAAPWRALVA
jgi:uncharacterized membrane protein SirB2